MVHLEKTCTPMILNLVKIFQFKTYILNPEFLSGFNVSEKEIEVLSEFLEKMPI